jgi:serine-type D-Ala-D-Ala carboxypeptidase (penicillin-binding protein 5/6)
MRGVTDTGRRAAAPRRVLAALCAALALWPAAVAAQRPDAGPAPGAGGAATGKAPAAAGGEAAKPAGPPQLDARAWILVDPRDGEVLAAEAPNKQRAIASATKLMTAYVALRKLSPGRFLRAAPYAAGAAESLLGLRTGERMRVRDLLYGLILASGNDAAVTIATGTAGSVPRFVGMMNRQAAALGLESTAFSNPVGLDEPGNHSSAADLAELASVLLRNRLFARIADTSSTVLRSGATPRRISSRNTLLFEDPSVDGVKTGHTIQAGYVLVGSATREGTRLVSAVLGAPSEAARDAETEELLDYGFSLYRASTPVKRGEQLAEPGLDYRDETLPLVATRAIEVSAREGQAVATEVTAPDELSGDIEEGKRLGRVTVSVDGERTAVAPLVASRSVEAATLIDKVASTAQNPAVLVPVGGFVILVGLLLAARGRRSRKGQPAADTPPEAPAREPRGERTPREKRERPPQRTPEERREMHDERMRRRRQREEGGP